jgi:membrane protease YdiL (CAAX protease family)
MTLPHDQEWPYRRAVFLVAALLSAVVIAAAPGHGLAFRIAAPAMALLAAGGGFVAGWVALKFQAVIWSQVFPRFIDRLCILAYYFFAVGGLLNLLVYPFVKADLDASGIPLSEIAMYLAAGAGAAAGAFRVLSDRQAGV